MHILVVNAGSSSVKLRLLDEYDEVSESADLAADSNGFDVGQLTGVLRRWPRPDAIVHRIVHGGREFLGAVRIDERVTTQLRALTELAPLHQPKSLAGLDAVTRLLPDVEAVACFDTAFHATLPDAAATYALPREWRERYGVRRYGFHGLSHSYCSRRAAELVGQPAEALRIVTCHLGAGASLAAVVDGRSVDTTMGFTPLDGLVMATRSGSVDPGLVLWLEEHEGVSAHEIATALETRSGLTALAGTGDLARIEERARGGDPDAVLAVAVYLHRLVGGIAAMAAAAGGVDVLAFTGGVGEHSPSIRQNVAERLAWLGVALDPVANAAADGDADISAVSASRDLAPGTVVVTAREDVEMAHQARTLLASEHS